MTTAVSPHGSSAQDLRLAPDEIVVTSDEIKARQTVEAFSDQVVVDPRLGEVHRPWIADTYRQLAEIWLRSTEVQGWESKPEDGRRIDVANVDWCTGFSPGFSWIDLPVFEERMREPNHDRGVVKDVPGLYFLGLKFLYSVSSEQIHGVGRDAAHIAVAIAARCVSGRIDRAVVKQEDHLESAHLRRSS